MKRPRFVLLTGLAALLVPCLPALGGTAGTDDALPGNVGLGLRRLATWEAAQPRTLSSSERRTRLAAALPELAERVQADAAATRAVVDVTLDGKAAPTTVHDALTALGADVFAQTPAVLSARLPLDQVGTAAQLPGVFSVSLVRRAHHWVGKATTQGRGVLNVNQLNAAGYDGTGLRVGVISDSFDAATLDSVGQPLTDHAADDIASGDLPGPGNPLGHLAPVTVLADADPADTTIQTRVAPCSRSSTISRPAPAGLLHDGAHPRPRSPPASARCARIPPRPAT